KAKVLLLLAGAALPCGTAFAQPAEPTAAPTVAVPSRSFSPADFARYSPKTALDMVNQIPGFAIRAGERLRGIGQATDNVLLNGERPATKSDDIFAQLTRIPAASVVRIDIVDAATLNLPGLAGQVANVIYKTNEMSGQFEYRPEYRPHNTDPLLDRGNISVTGTSGDVKYQVGLNNDG